MERDPAVATWEQGEQPAEHTSEPNDGGHEHARQHAGEVVGYRVTRGRRGRSRKPGRGRGGKGSRTHDSLVILHTHSNLRGFNSKKESLYKVLKDIKPDVN